MTRKKRTPETARKIRHLLRESYQHGFAAFGTDTSDCPESIMTTYRATWYSGYYDAHIIHHVGEILENHGTHWELPIYATDDK